MEKLDITHIGRDMARKCGDDVSDVVRRNILLCDTIDDRAWVAIFGASIAVASAVGAIRHILPEATPEEAISALIAAVQPMAEAALARFPKEMGHG